jgi:hypothetical protein
MNLVGIQADVDYTSSIAVALRHSPVTTDGAVYGGFTPKFGTLKWKSMYRNVTDLHKEIVSACKKVAVVTELQDPRKLDFPWGDSERASHIIAKLMYMRNDIAISTRMGQGNVIVLNFKFYNLLHELTPSFINPPIFAETSPGIMQICGVDTFVMDFDDCSNYPEAIITYHNNSPSSCGIIAAFNGDYYSLCTDIEDTKNYYRLLRIKNEL